MKKLVTLIALVAMLMLGLVAPASAQAVQHCPGANQGNAPAIEAPYEQVGEKVEAVDDELNGRTVDDFDFVCVKGGQGSTGIVAVEFQQTLKYYLDYGGVRVGNNNVPDVSYYITYREVPDDSNGNPDTEDPDPDNGPEPRPTYSVSTPCNTPDFYDANIGILSDGDATFNIEVSVVGTDYSKTYVVEPGTEVNASITGLERGAEVELHNIDSGRTELITDLDTDYSECGDDYVPDNGGEDPCTMVGPDEFDDEVDTDAADTEWWLDCDWWVDEPDTDDKPKPDTDKPTDDGDKPTDSDKPSDDKPVKDDKPDTGDPETDKPVDSDESTKVDTEVDVDTAAVAEVELPDTTVDAADTATKVDTTDASLATTGVETWHLLGLALALLAAGGLALRRSRV